MGQCLDSTVMVTAGPLASQCHLCAGATAALQGMLWLKFARVPAMLQGKL